MSDCAPPPDGSTATNTMCGVRDDGMLNRSASRRALMYPPLNAGVWFWRSLPMSSVFLYSGAMRSRRPDTRTCLRIDLNGGRRCIMCGQLVFLRSLRSHSSHTSFMRTVSKNGLPRSSVMLNSSL